MKVISYTSRFSNPQVLKLSTREGELLGFVHIPKYTNEFPIIGSPLPFQVFTDQSPLIHCLAKKVIIIPRSSFAPCTKAFDEILDIQHCHHA